MTEGGIDFGSGQPWGAINQTEYKRMAQEGRHPLAYRVSYAAMGWANRIGHAELGIGQLGRILADEDGQARDPQTVRNAVMRAKVLGLIQPSSRAACLVLGSLVFQKKGRGTAHCVTHQVGRW